jgi:DNA-binding PadR family transcriptional regulator
VSADKNKSRARSVVFLREVASSYLGRWRINAPGGPSRSAKPLIDRLQREGLLVVVREARGGVSDPHIKSHYLALTDLGLAFLKVWSPKETI